MKNALFLRLSSEATGNLRDQVCELISSAITRDLFSVSEPLPSCRSLCQSIKAA